MKTYETSATVENDGRLAVSGVPFPPGTEVKITVTSVLNGGAATIADTTDRTARLFAALDKGRNTEPIGPLRREELYDRQVLR